MFRYSATAQVSTPELIEIEPGVMVVADYDEPVFYSEGVYWRYYGGIWYRSPHYNRAWVRVSAPPVAVRRIPRPEYYVRYRAQVRDHREARAYPPPAPEVRDHRTTAPAPTPRPPVHDPIIRDQREDRREDKAERREERREEKVERREERREDKAERREDREERREDKAERRDDKQERREDKREHREDKRDDKRDHGKRGRH